MFAVDHAATALLIKRRYPTVSLLPLLLSVQAAELAWVLLNYLGLERTTTESAVRSVVDLHLEHMPYSHSIATVLGAALVSWGVFEFGMRKSQLGRAVGLAIASHIGLDLLTHAPDIMLWPGAGSPKLGFGLYGAAPFAAFVLELAYGLACWWLYRGGRGLLVLVSVGNLGNLSLLTSTVPGPEQFLADRPLVVVTLVAAQIVVTLLLTGLLARPRRQPKPRIRRAQSIATSGQSATVPSA